MEIQPHFFSSRARKNFTRLAVAAPIVLAFTGLAMAETLLATLKQTCTASNCNALEVRGAVTGTGTNISNPRSVPWVAQIAGNANSCLRLDVISSNVRFLEMTVISPNNGVRTGGTITSDPTKDCCPKVKVGSIPTPGFYTVIINDNGGGPVQGGFVLKYQEYNAGNPNCANPTVEQ